MKNLATILEENGNAPAMIQRHAELISLIDEQIPAQSQYRPAILDHSVYFENPHRTIQFFCLLTPVLVGFDGEEVFRYRGADDIKKNLNDIAQWFVGGEK